MIEVVFGTIGSGKSSYAMGQIDVGETFKIGIKPGLLAWLYTFRDIGKSHEEKNRAMGLSFGASTIDTIVEDISRVEAPVLFIDEWSTLFMASLLWSPGRIRERAEEILGAIALNPNIQRAIVVAVEFNGPTMFRLYKRLGLWNALLFGHADKITHVYYGIPQVIFERT